MFNRIIHADVLAGLQCLPADAFHCAVTSPPYWRLRSYQGVAPTLWADGMTCCLGAEPDPDSFIRHLVQVFSEVWRVLHPTGLLFVNLGETYASGKPKVNGYEGDSGLGWNNEQSADPPPGLKDGDRCGIPERFALAMQAAGWYWRDTIIWGKKSPMPSSQFGWRWVRCRIATTKSQRSSYYRHVESQNGVNRPQGERNGPAFADQSGRYAPCHGCPKCQANGGYILRKGRFRTTAAHEPIFMFAKSERYFADDQAASEPASQPNRVRADQMGGSKHNGSTTKHSDGAIFLGGQTRLPRSFWLLSSEPSKEKHFAAYPTAIPRKCIEMATSKAGCCPTCGNQYAPIVESERIATRTGDESKVTKLRQSHEHRGDIDPSINWRSSTLASEVGNRDPQRHVARNVVIGYRATCNCGGEPVPSRVLDPFLGSGTTAMVARHLGRDWCGIEASADYVAIAERRIAMPPKKQKQNGAPKPMPDQLSLFT